MQPFSSRNPTLYLTASLRCHRQSDINIDQCAIEVYRQWVSCGWNSSYSFAPIVLKLCRCFLHGMKMCMWFWYNPCYTPIIYAEGYIVFVFPFVCSFVLSYFHPLRGITSVLCASNSSGVYLTNHISESIHIWTIDTLEGWLSFHDSSPQGPCPGMGLEVKI